jgi:hypothetical protein
VAVKEIVGLTLGQDFMEIKCAVELWQGKNLEKARGNETGHKVRVQK